MNIFLNKKKKFDVYLLKYLNSYRNRSKDTILRKKVYPIDNEDDYEFYFQKELVKSGNKELIEACNMENDIDFLSVAINGGNILNIKRILFYTGLNSVNSRDMRYLFQSKNIKLIKFLLKKYNKIHQCITYGVFSSNLCLRKYCLNKHTEKENKYIIAQNNKIVVRSSYEEQHTHTFEMNNMQLVKHRIRKNSYIPHKFRHLKRYMKNRLL